MNRRRLIFTALILLFLALGGTWSSSFGEDTKSATILFTHDMHSHLLPAVNMVNEELGEYGGFARLKTVIDKERDKEPDAVLLDGGDFSMGTLFQTIFSEEAPELRLLGLIGYDATTFGNHEFDYRSSGLSQMLKTAMESKDPLPLIVAANLERDETGEGPVALLQKTLDEYGVQDYIILERAGVKIGIFGIMGYDSIETAPMSEIGFLDPLEQAKAVVAEMKEKESPDLIICLSHSGVWDDPKDSEDQILAGEIPEIDVIISGHNHTIWEQPLVEGDTLIVSAGEYSGNLGKLKVFQTEDGRWAVDSYEMLPVDQTVAEDSEIAAIVKQFQNKVETEYLNPFGLTYSQVIARSPFPFTEFKYFAKEQGEDPLGSLIADSYIQAVQAAEGDAYEPIAVAVVPAGVIRGSIAKGDVTVSDLFNISSLGIGKDGTSGYPLISVYLTGRELWSIAEVDASVTPIMTSAQLYTSGLEYTFNPNRLIFNKVTDVKLVSADGSLIEPEEDELYRVVCGLYSGQMLGAVKGKTFGLISLDPKDKDGNPIRDFEDHIIMNGDLEVKEWLALVSYLGSFPKDGDGIPVIPASYSAPEGRKNIEYSTALMDRLENPNHVFYLLVGAVLTFLFLLILVIYLLRRRKQKRRARNLA